MYFEHSRKHPSAAGLRIYERNIEVKNGSNSGFVSSATVNIRLQIHKEMGLNFLKEEMTLEKLF